MLCSRCSTLVRPIVCFDIDGVLGDYHSHFHKFAASYISGTEDVVLEKRLNEYDGGEPHGEFFEDMGISRAKFRAIKLAYRQGSMKRTMPPFTRMVECVDKVKARNAEVWLTTTRPYLRLDNVDPDTRFWLANQGVPFDYMLYDEVKYQELAQRVERPRVVAIIDDEWEQYEDAESVFGPGVPILNKIKANRGVFKMASADNATEAWKMIRTRLDNYERNYG